MKSYPAISRRLRGHGHARPSLGTEALTDFREALSSWPVNQFRTTLEAELSKENQRTVTTITEQTGERKHLLSTAIQEVHADRAALFQRYRNRVGVSHYSITKSLLLEPSNMSLPVMPSGQRHPQARIMTRTHLKNSSRWKQASGLYLPG